MFNLRFWKTWPHSQQKLFWAFATLAILSLGFLWYAEFNTPSPVIEALRSPEIDAAQFTHHSFRIGTFDLSIPADVLLILERTNGGPLKPNTAASVGFLVVLSLSLIAIVSIITTLSRFWFFTGVGFFSLMLLGFRIETILLFGMSDYWPVAGIIFLYAALAFYFALANSKIDFTIRYFSFLLLTGGIGIGIHFFSTSTTPFYELSANAMVVGTILTIIFIFTIAPEILAALVAVISRGTRQTKSMRHFMIISAIYMVNLALIYANRKLLIHWEFLAINLMVFVTLSGILGLWGFRHREPQYEAIFKANPTGVLLYLALASIGFVTIGYFFANANDPAIRLTEDAIIYSHLGYGIIFLIYVINNFGSMLYKDLQMYNVLYKPSNMPYFTFRLMGLIATFVFFAYSNWRASVNQVYAGYYNAKGDVYLQNDTLNLSESYYAHSAKYALRNYHAHYALAQINAAKGDPAREKKEYSLLVNSRPLDLAYLNLSALEHDRNAPQIAMNTLRAGLKDFPKNGRLENELALEFASTRQKDSALYYVQRALRSSEIRGVAETNRVGLIVRFFPELPVDSIMSISDLRNSGVKANLAALACLQNKSIALPPYIDNDSAISVYQVLSLHNYWMNRNEEIDTVLLSKTIALAHKTENPYYRDFLLSGAAFALYEYGEKGHAIRILREAAFAGQVDDLFNALGLWSLEQRIPLSATRYFDEAIKQDFQPAVFNRAISLTESGDRAAALDAWRGLLTSEYTKFTRQAKRMIDVLSDAGRIEALDDEGKYMYARYRVDLLDISAFERVVNSIADPEWKVKAVLDRSTALDEAGEKELAIATFDAIGSVPVRNTDIYQELIHLQLMLTISQNNMAGVDRLLQNKKLSFAGKYRTQKVYLDALKNSLGGKKETKKQMEWLLHADPFFEDAVVTSAKYLAKDSTQRLKIYSSVVSALDVNPDSPKLLKVYAVMSLDLDFPDAGQTTMDRLKSILSHEAFLAFLKERPDLFQIGEN